MALLIIPAQALATDVTLTWDSGHGENIAGYRVFCREAGQSYDFNLPAWEGVDTVCTLHDLDDGKAYCFVARSFDDLGNESASSEEACYTPSNAGVPVEDPGSDETSDEPEGDGDGGIVALVGLAIAGNTELQENGTTAFTAVAAFSSGSSCNVSAGSSWSVDSQWATINGDGVLSAEEVDGDQQLVVTATYSCGGLTASAQKSVWILDTPDSNGAPNRPVIVTPHDGAVNFALLDALVTDSFSDPDGDTHGRSRWQIGADEEFSSLVLDLTSETHLEALPIPHGVLESGRVYYGRVQFHDALLEPSVWSESVTFETVERLDDTNGDGVADEQEVGPEVDLNGDGIADADQPETIKCIQPGDEGSAMGVGKASSSIAAIEQVEVVDPTTIADSLNRPVRFPCDLISYRLRVDEPGAFATVRLYFSKRVAHNAKLYKYDPVLGWHEYSEHCTFHSDRRSVSLELQDGGFGDSDGVANGVIVDPAGLGVDQANPLGTAVGGSDAGYGASGGCFVGSLSLF